MSPQPPTPQTPSVQPLPTPQTPNVQPLPTPQTPNVQPLPTPQTPNVQPLPTMIGEPCPGIIVRGNNPERRDSLIGTTLLVDWEQGISGGFEWAGPYYDDEDSPARRGRYPLLEVNIADWRMEEIEGGIRHLIEMEWPPFLETGLFFRVDTGGCERRELVCDRSGCELRP
ncbi:MAG: hypothetical protein OXC11_15460 [Rhodospirillales bacterium]|nr:hypothetical protein [Rhodospirillales bacterium]